MKPGRFLLVCLAAKNCFMNGYNFQGGQWFPVVPG
jgi:hypothetical protein